MKYFLNSLGFIGRFWTSSQFYFRTELQLKQSYFRYFYCAGWNLIYKRSWLYMYLLDLSLLHLGGCLYLNLLPFLCRDPVDCDLQSSQFWKTWKKNWNKSTKDQKSSKKISRPQNQYNVSSFSVQLFCVFFSFSYLS